MARSLGITVCCEGVETESYLFSKPVEEGTFEQRLLGDSL